MKILLERCPRCGGNLYIDAVLYLNAEEIKCLMCSRPASTQEEVPTKSLRKGRPSAR